MKQRILKKAEELFFTYGYSKTTMDELASELKMSKKTIYSIFPSKQALLNEVIDNYFNNIKIEIDSQLDEGMSFQEMIRNLLYIIHLKSSTVKIRALEDIEKNSPASWNKIKKFRRSFLQTRLKEIFKKGREEGIVKENICLDLVVMITMNSIQNICTTEMLTQLPYSIEQTLDMIIEMITEGIIVRKR